MSVHDFCRTLANQECKKNRIKISQIYTKRIGINDSHWFVDLPSKFKHQGTFQGCCKWSVIFNCLIDLARDIRKRRER